MTDTKIFVVLDPHHMEQSSLEWSEMIALTLTENRSVGVKLHVYCCVDSSSVKTKLAVRETSLQGDLDKTEEWVERLVAHTRSLGIDVTTEVEREESWGKAILGAITRNESDLVVKSMTHHTRLVRLTRETSDWQLLRNIKYPIFLVNATPPSSIDKLLVAIKPNSDDEIYEEANDRLLETARRMTGDFGATLDVVACFKTEKYPDRQRFADRCGLERNQVHAFSGVPEKVIASVATDVGADILIIASLANKEKSAFGDTAQKVLDELDIDVLVLPVAP
ncbi:MAG: universal stress protein [bacterium]